jgi:two-component system cell cycle response regulator
LPVASGAIIRFASCMPRDIDSNPVTLVVDTRAAPATRSRGVLTVVGGLHTGRVMALPRGEEVTLGRADGCTYRLDDASVSGTHARIIVVAGSYMFVDASSTNGSFVNDVRTDKPVELKDGDRIQLGSASFFRFSLVTEEEEVALRKIYEAASRDGLTGVFNRKHLEERIDAEIAFAIRHKTEVSLVMIDVDYFKKVNDTHGHLAGDAVLKNTAQLLAQGIRTEDVLARYGGEEFVIVTRGVPALAAGLLADRLRQKIGQAEVVFGGARIRVTVSAGVASLDCCDGKRDKSTLLGIADARLYKAKQAGRNRVIGPV